MSLLIDIAGLNDGQTDQVMEFICKAQHDDDLSDAIFDQHPSPFIRRLVELFYDRGLLRLTDFRNDIEKWLEGKHYRPGPIPQRPDGAMSRWTPAELQLVKIYLTALPSEQFVLDDYMLLIDFLFQRYLPAEDMRTEAQWLATRATLMGRVQANMADITPQQADVLLGALPPSIQAAKQTFTMSAIQSAIIDYAGAHTAENVVSFTETARHRLKRAILAVEEARLTERPGTISSALQTRLFDEFGALNRDWRRVAVTEATENMLQGQICSMPLGSHVKRIEQYRGACPFCKRIDGKVMEVVAADATEKDGATQVWPGKTNIGRSAAPRKRVGSDLVERDPEERWWLPAGTAHPHCRGRWLPTVEPRAGDDVEFSEWLSVTLGDKSTGEKYVGTHEETRRVA
jgi:hypothetical protein